MGWGNVLTIRHCDDTIVTDIITNGFLLEFSPVMNRSKILKFIPTESLASRFWSSSLPSGGKQKVVKYYIDSLGIHLDSWPVPNAMRNKMITDRYKLFWNELRDYRYRLVTDSNCLGVNYGLPMPTS